MQQALEIEAVVGADTLQTFPQLRPFLGHRIRVIALDLEPVLPPPSPPDPPQPSKATSAAPLTGDAVVDHYQPRTELGRRLIELRRAYVEGGGKLLSWEEIDAESRERRGGVADD
jgi:hypothetical protein